MTQRRKVRRGLPISAEKLDAIMLKRGMSHEELQRVSGVSRRTIQRWAGPKGSANHRLLTKVADALTCNITDLLKETDVPVPTRVEFDDTVREGMIEVPIRVPVRTLLALQRHADDNGLKLAEVLVSLMSHSGDAESIIINKETHR